MSTVKPKFFAHTPTNMHHKSTSPWIWFSFKESATSMYNHSTAMQLQDLQRHVSAEEAARRR